jgi:hypothetical protein
MTVEAKIFHCCHHPLLETLVRTFTSPFSLCDTLVESLTSSGEISGGLPQLAFACDPCGASEMLVKNGSFRQP